MDKYEAQRLGTNADAQSVLKNEVSAFFPQLEAEQEISAEVIGQFYDWQFPFTYTQDGGGARRWRASVRAVCRRNKKLQQLEELFESSGTDGTLKEVYSGQDEDEYTDNHATRTKTEFAGVGTTTSENLGDTTTNEPVDGKNNTTTVRKKGTTRTYADGRTWTQILKDVGAAVDPVDEFINAFAQVLLPPCEDPCFPLPPSVSMTVEVEELPAGTPPTAEIVNKGSSLAADWLLSLGVPNGKQGIKGDKGETGAPALTYDNVYYSNAPVVVGLRIIQESFKFNRAAEIGDTCIIVCAETTTTPFAPYITVCNVVRGDTGDGYVWLDVANAVNAKGDKVEAAKKLYLHEIQYNVVGLTWSSFPSGGRSGEDEQNRTFKASAITSDKNAYTRIGDLPDKLTFIGVGRTEINISFFPGGTEMVGFRTSFELSHAKSDMRAYYLIHGTYRGVEGKYYECINGGIASESEHILDNVTEI